MIRPKIPLVQSGQRLTSDLVNSMIHRTEYAADLLRQYRLTAGTEMYVEPHYDGTRVSYLQPVGGGQILPPITTKAKIIICGTSIKTIGNINREIPFLFDYSTNTFTDLNIQENSFGAGAYGINKNYVTGFFYPDNSFFPKGFIFNTDTQITTTVNQGGQEEFNTLLYKNNGVVAVGYSDAPDNIDAAIIYSISSGGISKKFITGYEHTDISQNIICGTAIISGQFRGYTFSVETNEVISTFNYPGAQNSTAYGIYSNLIVGWYQNFGQQARGYLYDGANFLSYLHPDSQSFTRFFGVAGNYVVGSFDDASDGIQKGLLYNIETGEWEKFIHPSGRSTRFYGIDKSYF